MGPNKNNLKYKTFDSLLADVMVDFKSYAQENLIDPQELIRVARWVTQDLGLRVFQTKQALLEVHNHKVRLPEDFYSFNYGMMCVQGSQTIAPIQGVSLETIPYPPTYQQIPDSPDTCLTTPLCPEEAPCGKCSRCNAGLVLVPGFDPLQPLGSPCVKPRVFMDCKGNSFELIQTLQTQTRHYRDFLPLKLVASDEDVWAACPNVGFGCKHEIRIKSGFIFANICNAEIYINYEGLLEDEQGNILVVDRPKITEYYEYKLKHRILENLFINGEDVERKLSYIRLQLRDARIEALNIVNMPDFAEIHQTWLLNRKAYNYRFVNMFRSHNWYGYGWR